MPLLLNLTDHRNYYEKIRVWNPSNAAIQRMAARGTTTLDHHTVGRAAGKSAHPGGAAYIGGMPYTAIVGN